MKVELTKKWRKFKKGDVVDVTPEMAKELVETKNAKYNNLTIEKDGINREE